jgi:hypothetical protein
MVHTTAVIVGTIIGLAIRWAIQQSRASRQNQG